MLEGIDFFSNLNCKFSRRNENDDLDIPIWFQFFNQRDAKSCGLSGTGFCLSDDVFLIRQKQRDDLHLNR